eukprot:3602448-Amphidinium_carterae.3
MGDSSELVGPAAVAMQPKAETKRLKGGVLKAKSISPGAAASSVKAPSEMGDVRRNLHDVLARADSINFDEADEMSDAQAGQQGDQVDYWKWKCPLQGLLQKLETGDKIDRRTLKGMEKAYKRLLESKHHDGNIVGNRLKAYHYCATEVVNGTPGQVKVLSDADYEKWLKVIKGDGLVLPSKFQKSVLSRRCATLIDKQDWQGLLQCMSPFEPADEFNVDRPKLADLSVEQKEKVNKFLEVAKDILVGMIKESLNVENTVKFCVICREFFQEVDLVEVDTVSASLWAGCCSIWRALPALSDASDVSLEQEVLTSTTLVPQSI